jgi:hypothetical protein
MSATNALNFIGKLDRREETLIMGAQQRQAFLQKLMGNRDPRLVKRFYGSKRVRDVYTPPTRGVDGTYMVMPKN